MTTTGMDVEKIYTDPLLKGILMKAITMKVSMESACSIENLSTT